MPESLSLSFETQNPSLADKDAYEKATQWLDSENEVDVLVEIGKLWRRLPFNEDLSPEEQELVGQRIASANDVLPHTENIVQQKYPTLDTKVLLENVRDFTHPLLEENRNYQIAACFVFFKLYARALETCQKKEEADLRARLVFFGAVHDFLVGVKTNVFEFTRLLYGHNRMFFELLEETEAVEKYSEKTRTLLKSNLKSSNGHPKAS